MAKIASNKLNQSRIRKFSIAILFLFLIIVSYLIYVFFIPTIFTKNGEKAYLRIPTNSTFEDVIDSLESNATVNTFAFKQVSFLLKYGVKIRPGRYPVNNAMSNFKLVRILRSGRQTPVNLTFNNIRTKEQLAARLAKQLMSDSLSIIRLLNDSSKLSVYGLNPENAISVFIPNTYEVFWNVSPEDLLERMNREYDTFWTDERKQKAQQIPLTLHEVSTLASIVEEETNVKKERSLVAGLYINRIKINMPLQADPTLKFAVGDFSIRRLLKVHILKSSPYNTYLNIGLPPGPIRIATPQAIDAVLNYSHHNYIYMCAKETLNGEHNFAVTYPEHQKNARLYQKALNERKIFK